MLPVPVCKAENVYPITFDPVPGLWVEWIARIFGCLAELRRGYISPKVDAISSDVTVVAITPGSVGQANQQPYTPKPVPTAFSQSVGNVTGAASFDDLPQPAQMGQPAPTTLSARFPPIVEPGPYRIGVCDVMNVASQLSASSSGNLQGYTVQDNGAIALPDVGRVVLAGLTCKRPKRNCSNRKSTTRSTRCLA